VVDPASSLVSEVLLVNANFVLVVIMYYISWGDKVEHIHHLDVAHQAKELLVSCIHQTAALKKP
jgi:hypothetical protein